MIKTVQVKKNEIEKIERLLQLYLHDISLYFDIDFDSKNCKYIYDDLKKYFDKSGNYAFFIKEKTIIKGFILVDKTESGMCVQEIFVLNNYKKSGIGQKAAFAIFDKFRGNWIIKTLPKSPIAEKFWINVIQKYTSGDYKMTRVGRYDRAVFEFNNN